MMKKPTFNKTELSSPITEFAISIGAYQGNNYIVSGTATFVAPFLAITAKHVVEHYWREFNRSQIKSNEDGTHKEHAGKFNMAAIQILNNGTEGALWDVRQVYFSNATDIAYLHLVPFSDSARNYKWRLPKIEMLPPKIGSTVSAFGYTQSKATADTKSVTWEYDARTSQGVVLDIHQNKRDEFSINFPCIYTNTQFDPGMSGGPVFNQEGKLCAIISANLPPSEEGEEHASYAALIWPSMNVVINLKREGIDYEGYYPILELCRGGFIKADNHERVNLADTDL